MRCSHFRDGAYPNSRLRCKAASRGSTALGATCNGGSRPLSRTSPDRSVGTRSRAIRCCTSRRHFRSLLTHRKYPDLEAKLEGQAKLEGRLSWRDRSNIVLPRFLDVQRRITRERVPTASNVGCRDLTWAAAPKLLRDHRDLRASFSSFFRSYRSGRRAFRSRCRGSRDTIAMRERP